jgi:hypothetical protein
MTAPGADLEGRLAITLTRRGDAAAEARIVSSRPQLAQRLMAGREPQRAAELAGLLFTLCGGAQRVAAESALAASGGDAASGDPAQQIEARVLAELAREHVWLLLARGPELTGLAPAAEALLRLRRAEADAEDLARTLDALLVERVLGEPAAAWLGRDAAGLADWIAGGATLAAAFLARIADAPAGRPTALLPPLRALDDATVLDLARQALEQPAFCARPTWRGAPAETGALARQRDAAPVADWIARHGHGHRARLLARLAELAGLPARLRGADGPAVARAWPLGEGAGVAGVETSRGLLLHVARLVAGRVADYRIVAPTEWNFHPEGPLAAALAGLAPDDTLADRARHAVLALDPCVAFGVEVIDA